MKCPIFSGAYDGFCLRERCKWFDTDLEKCVYEKYQELKTNEREERGPKSSKVATG